MGREVEGIGRSAESGGKRRGGKLEQSRRLAKAGPGTRPVLVTAVLTIEVVIVCNAKSIHVHLSAKIDSPPGLC